MEEYGVVPAEELAGDNMSEEIVENQYLSEETVDIKDAVWWKVKAISDEVSMGDQVDLPFGQHKDNM